jgi:hypothetical protein
MTSGKGRGGGPKQPLGDAIGKPRVEHFDELSEMIGDISEAEQARRLALQEPLRVELFGGLRTPESLGRERTGGFTGQRTRGAFAEFLQEGTLPVSLQMPYQLYNEALASQGQQARQNIIARSGARGGQLTDLLAQANLAEAQSRAQIPLLEGDVRNALFQQALGTAVGQEFPVVQGFGTAGNIAYQGEDLNLRFKEQFTSNIGFAAGGGGKG